MSEENDFGERIIARVAKLENELGNLNENILSPQYHVERSQKALQQALGELAEKESENVVQELISIINQVPEFVGQAWIDAGRVSVQLGSQLDIWRQVQLEYSESQVSDEPEENEKIESVLTNTQADLTNDFLDSVRLGDIIEPTKMGSIRRNSGSRPESLSKVRRAQTELKKSSD
jgi:plasmid maintenance system antidote protein VapI